MLTSDPTLLAMMGKPDCSGRYRFSKRQRPKSMRRDWCPWCRSLLKGTDGCPVLAALSTGGGQ